MNKLSVILTTYNGEKTVEKTISSILNQEGINSEFKLELIIIDDCSTDNTISILKQFDSLLVSTEKNSGGPNKGRNIGLGLATGDYICIADQDDIWEKNKVKLILPHLRSVPIVSSGYKLIDEKNYREITRVNQSSEGTIYYKKNETFLKRLTKSLKGQNTYLGSLVFRKELKDIQFEEHFGAVDFDWLLQLFHLQDSIEVCQPLYLRFVYGNNLSLNETYRKYDFYYSLMTLEKYQELYPSEVSLSYKKIHGSRARFYYVIGDMKKARFYFSRSRWTLKTLLYYLTTFIGHKYIKRNFNIFG
jgi:glycosyltransferase involved in cell wall biosynthesis